MSCEDSGVGRDAAVASDGGMGSGRIAPNRLSTKGSLESGSASRRVVREERRDAGDSAGPRSHVRRSLPSTSSIVKNQWSSSENSS